MNHKICSRVTQPVIMPNSEPTYIETELSILTNNSKRNYLGKIIMGLHDFVSRYLPTELFRKHAKQTPSMVHVNDYVETNS